MVDGLTLSFGDEKHDFMFKGHLKLPPRSEYRRLSGFRRHALRTKHVREVLNTREDPELRGLLQTFNSAGESNKVDEITQDEDESSNIEDERRP